MIAGYLPDILKQHLGYSKGLILDIGPLNICFLNLWSIVILSNFSHNMKIMISLSVSATIKLLVPNFCNILLKNDALIEKKRRKKAMVENCLDKT
ncbi:MAG: hypothetical protein ACRC4N_17300 [Gammaproteobacteria bacterium]